jgi:nucleotide-binding universal stress UspA family protein
MFETIAVGTDGTPTAAKALDLAIDLAQHYSARLVVISAFQPVDEMRLKHEQARAPADLAWAINPTSEVDTILEKAARKAKARGLNVTTVASDGAPADVLCKFAEDQGADILVIGNKGMQRRILGSVPNSVAHKAPCAVLIVKTT